jgi:hypothetical protein
LTDKTINLSSKFEENMSSSEIAFELYTAVQGRDLEKIADIVKTHPTAWRSNYYLSCDCGCDGDQISTPVEAVFLIDDPNLGITFLTDLFANKILSHSDLSNRFIFDKFCHFGGSDCDIAILNFLIDNIPNDRLVTLRNRQNLTLLHEFSGALCNCDAIFERLIQIGIDPTHKSHHGTLITALICKVNIKLVKRMIDQYHLVIEDTPCISKFDQPCVSYVLEHLRSTKLKEDIDNVKGLLAIAIRSNYNFMTLDGRGFNVYDYISTFGWTPIFKSVGGCFERASIELLPIVISDLIGQYDTNDVPEPFSRNYSAESILDGYYLTVENQTTCLEISKWILENLFPIRYSKDLKLIEMMKIRYIEFLAEKPRSILGKIVKNVNIFYNNSFGFSRFFEVQNLFQYEINF